MPCHPARAGQLLRQGKAKVVSRTPFQVQLVFGSSGYRQQISLGADSGYLHLGLSAVTANRGVYAAEVVLRDDMVKLNAERAQYRRGRRYRHTWYRKPRFLNRKKPEGWLAPSIRNKLDTQLKAVEQVTRLLPVSSIVVEVAAFDIQKIRDPEIAGVDYQNGPQRDFWNVRE
jgi:N6-L-threonylcarbamoyladenine synthase